MNSRNEAFDVAVYFNTKKDHLSFKKTHWEIDLSTEPGDNPAIQGLNNFPNDNIRNVKDVSDGI